MFVYELSGCGFESRCSHYFLRSHLHYLDHLNYSEYFCHPVYKLKHYASVYIENRLTWHLSIPWFPRKQIKHLDFDERMTFRDRGSAIRLHSWLFVIFSRVSTFNCKPLSRLITTTEKSCTCKIIRFAGSSVFIIFSRIIHKRTHFSRFDFL